MLPLRAMAWRTPQDTQLLVSEHTRNVLSQLQSNPNVTRWALQASGKASCCPIDC